MYLIGAILYISSPQIAKKPTNLYSTHQMLNLHKYTLNMCVTK